MRDHDLPRKSRAFRAHTLPALVAHWRRKTRTIKLAKQEWLGAPLADPILLWSAGCIDVELRESSREVEERT